MSLFNKRISFSHACILVTVYWKRQAENNTSELQETELELTPHLNIKQILSMLFFIPAQIIFLRCPLSHLQFLSSQCSIKTRSSSEIFTGSSNSGCRSTAISTNTNWVLMSWIELRLCSTPRPAATENRKVFPLHPCACMTNRECCFPGRWQPLE